VNGGREYVAIVACAILLPFILTYAGVPERLIPPVLYAAGALYVLVLAARLAVGAIWYRIEEGVWWAFADCWDGR